MSWNTLQIKAEKLGYQIDFRTQCSEQGGYMPDLTPPRGRGWVLVGNYDHIAGFWVNPLANGKVKLNRNQVRKLLTECDPFVETAAEYNKDFLQVQASYLATMSSLERD